MSSDSEFIQLYAPCSCLIIFHIHISHYPYSFGLNSLTHSLQIHCIWLIGTKPHIIWAWALNRDPTIGAVCGEVLVHQCVQRLRMVGSQF